MFAHTIESATGERIESVLRAFSRLCTDHDYGTRKPIHDATQSFEPVETGHFVVEYDDVRIERSDFLKPFRSAAGGRNHLKSGFRADQPRESGAHESTVIDHDYANSVNFVAAAFTNSSWAHVPWPLAYAVPPENCINRKSSFTPQSDSEWPRKRYPCGRRLLKKCWITLPLEGTSK